MTSHDVKDAVPLLHDYLRRSAARLPEKTALVCGDRRLSYRDLDRDSNALANAFEARGVGRGDRVLIFTENSVATVVGFWAALKANAVACVINPLTKREKLEYLLKDCRPAALVSESQLYGVFAPKVTDVPSLRTVVVGGSIDDARLRQVANGVRLDEAIGSADPAQPPPRRCLDVDLASIIYTSGSTGEAKGVMLTHRNMLTAATSITSLLGMTEDDVVLDVLPLAFNYGLYQMILCFRQGACLVLERSFAYPAHVMNIMIRERVTGFPGVPTIFAVLGEMRSLEPESFPLVRFVTNTAAALTSRHIESLKRLFPNAEIYSMYGLTECKRCTYLPPKDLERKPTSVGIPIPNTELWLVDQQGNRLGPNEVGELVIRGATVMRGYWERPEATAERLRPGPLPSEVVLYTGDYCKLDDEGYLYFVSRMDDIIKSRGEKVSPKEVETVLMNIPGVKEAAVIGVPDEILGQAVKAFVVLEDGADLTVKELTKQCHGRLESFMVPKYMELVAALPRTETGKVTKRGLS